MRVSWADLYLITYLCFLDHLSVKGCDFPKGQGWIISAFDLVLTQVSRYLCRSRSREMAFHLAIVVAPYLLDSVILFSDLKKKYFKIKQCDLSII